jgi:hypothetical protein
MQNTPSAGNREELHCFLQGECFCEKRKRITAKINILTDSAGNISGLDFSEAPCAGAG